MADWVRLVMERTFAMTFEEKASLGEKMILDA